MFESRGIRLVRETVGSKSAKLYRPCLKLTSIQSKVVPNKGYIYHKKLQTDGIAELNKGSLNYSEENMLYSEEASSVKVHIETCMMATMKVCLFLLSSLNATICMNSSLRQMFYGIYKPSDIMNFLT